MPDSQVVTRFAPSPTGYLHVGGARTALFNWLLARHTGGKYFLRIEDTDLARSTQAAVDAVLEDLRWLGLNHDNAELVFQSKRLAVYNRIIADLIARGLAYKAYETPEELDALRKAAETQKRNFVYRREQRNEDPARRAEAEGRPHVVRFVMPVEEQRFTDVVIGKEIVMPADEAQDFVIRKADGMPTYHFGVVVDDAEMGITHVLRGQEHLKNTFYHIALQEALDYRRPVYAHLPIILNTDGSKMGKRDRDKKVRAQTHNWLKNTKKLLAELSSASGVPSDRLQHWLDTETSQLDPSEHARLMPVIGLSKADLPEILVHDFRENGYLPEVLLNFLSLLGWNPGGDRERMSMDELVQLFALEGIGSSNARFNREKLLAFNTDACATLPTERLIEALRQYFPANPESPLARATDEQLSRIVRMKKGYRTLREIDEPARFFFVTDEQIRFDPAAVDKVLARGGGFDVLRDLRPLLASAEPWSHATIEAVVKQYCDSKQLGLGKVAQPLRVAISGGTISPPIFESLEFLGKPSALARIDRCIESARG